ncbi:MAG: hypothetical protein JOY99_06625 [Sphingomonadaceae bacterium]|nr:hypothetical protein [Sphingomonadaceae bacterium]
MADPAARIEAALAAIGPAVVACSGGVDSTLLAVIAHRRASRSTVIAHAISPAVPPEATARVRAMAAAEGWDLRLVRSGEFSDENYLSNPLNRCYFCKSNLYDSLVPIARDLGARGTVLSGANLDDLGEYRPGLDAAAEHGVRHPWIEAAINKATIRTLARSLELDCAELPASPCLASRLYTGTRVTAARLAAIHVCETLIRARTGLAVVRCRIDDGAMRIEVGEVDRRRIDDALIAEIAAAAAACEPSVTAVRIDPEPYRPGRAFVGAR